MEECNAKHFIRMFDTVFHDEESEADLIESDFYNYNFLSVGSVFIVEMLDGMMPLKSLFHSGDEEV